MFYDRFIQLCEQKGVKPTRAAIENGIARSAVSNWKSNWAKGIESLPSTANANALAEYFGVSVDYLLGNGKEPSPQAQVFVDTSASMHTAEKKPAAQTGGELGFDDFTYALHNETKKLTEENKQKLLEMAKFFQQQQELTAQREKDKNN